MQKHNNHPPRRAIDADHVCSHLTWLFDRATKNEHQNGKATKGTELHSYQVEFCYRLDNIKRGPVYLQAKTIAECNAFIESTQQTFANK